MRFSFRFSCFVVAITLLFIGKSVAQSSHKHAHGEHIELGVAIGAVYLMSENELAPGIHLHLLKPLHSLKRLNVGVGFETIIDDHKHFTVGVVGKYAVFNGLMVLLSPGITFVNEENSWERSFSSHLELLYEFSIGQIHIGPALGYSYSPKDQHAMLGVHLAYGF
jgi:hypothetical protein